MLRAGDLVKVDVTAELGGYVADACESLPVGAVDRETERLRAAADAALRRGIAVAPRRHPAAGRRRRGRRVVEGARLPVLRDLTGHGVGHFDPRAGDRPDCDTPFTRERLTEGLVIIASSRSSGRRRPSPTATTAGALRTRDGRRSAPPRTRSSSRADQPIVLTAAHSRGAVRIVSGTAHQTSTHAGQK